jgi:hypothetical protein
VALVAAAGLAVSFWGLMYARFKLRQVGTVAPMLLAFHFFFRAFQAGASPRARQRDAVLAALWLSASLYTYYAARAIPLIWLALAAYLLLAHQAAMRGRWRPLALTAALTVVVVAPLAVAIALTPQSQARLSVVGAPLAALLRGDPSYMLRNTAQTLAMPVLTGDPEYLYNIPGRPVFEPLGAALMALGLGLAVWRWRQPRYAVLVIWLLGGLAPAFASTPAASLGHTIVAQPVFYLLPALGVAALGGWAQRRLRLGRIGRAAPLAMPALALVFLGVTASRDLSDYFGRWPALPQVRVLYRADLHAAAPALRQLPPHTVLGLASAALHPADALALELDTPGLDLQPRVFTPARAWPFPDQSQPVLLLGSAGAVAFGQPPVSSDFQLRSSSLPGPATPLTAAFQNGWQLYGYTLSLRRATAGLAVALDTYWQVGADYSAPAPRPVDILTAQPLPLKIFSHVLRLDTPPNTQGAGGSVLTGDDRLDIDPATLRAGDSFVQTFLLAVPAGVPPDTYPVQIGLYAPASGARVLLTNGDDSLILTKLELPQ